MQIWIKLIKYTTNKFKSYQCTKIIINGNEFNYRIKIPSQSTKLCLTVKFISFDVGLIFLKKKKIHINQIFYI
jgi:hypothetical protein